MALTKISRGLLDTGVSDSSDATAITIDSSEKVGLNGLSAGDYWSSSNQLVFGNTASAANGGMTIATATNAVGQIYFADGTSGNAQYRGQIQYTHVSDAMDFATAATFAMRIDSAGRVMIGTTTEGQADADDLTVANASGNVGISLRTTTAGYASIYFSDATSGGAEASGAVQYKHDDNFLRFTTAESERMRIDSSGNVGINTTSSAFKLEVQESTASAYATRVMHTGNPNSGPPQIMRLDFWNTPNNGTSEFIKCRDTVSGTAVNRAVIMSNGGIGNFTTNDFNYSDERMKKDISNATAQLDNVKKLQLKTFRYKEQEDSEPTNLGVIAQDIQTDFPALVTEQGEGDEARLGVKEQQIMWMAVKAIQEQQDIIDDLKSRIETLEG